MYRTITPKSFDRGIATLGTLTVQGVGRDVLAMRANGHTNPAARTYDHKSAKGNRFQTVAFSGDVTFFRKSTGWVTVRDAEKTYTFAPDSLSVWTLATAPGLPVSCDLNTLFEYGTD